MEGWKTRRMEGGKTRKMEGLKGYDYGHEFYNASSELTNEAYERGGGEESFYI